MKKVTPLSNHFDASFYRCQNCFRRLINVNVDPWCVNRNNRHMQFKWPLRFPWITYTKRLDFFVRAALADFKNIPHDLCVCVWVCANIRTPFTNWFVYKSIRNLFMSYNNFSFCCSVCYFNTVAHTHRNIFFSISNRHLPLQWQKHGQQ